MKGYPISSIVQWYKERKIHWLSGRVSKKKKTEKRDGKNEYTNELWRVKFKSTSASVTKWFIRQTNIQHAYKLISPICLPLPLLERKREIEKGRERDEERDRDAKIDPHTHTHPLCSDIQSSTYIKWNASHSYYSTHIRLYKWKYAKFCYGFMLRSTHSLWIWYEFVCGNFECSVTWKMENIRIYSACTRDISSLLHFIYLFIFLFTWTVGRSWSADVHCRREDIMCEYNRNSFLFRKKASQMLQTTFKTCVYVNVHAYVHHWHLCAFVFILVACKLCVHF